MSDLKVKSLPDNEVAMILKIWDLIDMLYASISTFNQATHEAFVELAEVAIEKTKQQHPDEVEAVQRAAQMIDVLIGFSKNQQSGKKSEKNPKIPPFLN